MDKNGGSNGNNTFAFPSFKSAPKPLTTAVTKPPAIKEPLQKRKYEREVESKEEPGFDIDRRGDVEVFRYGKFAEASIPLYHRIANEPRHGKVKPKASREKVDFRQVLATKARPCLPKSDPAWQEMSSNFLELSSEEESCDSFGEATSTLSEEFALMSKQEQLNEAVTRNPNDPGVWLQLVDLQEQIWRATGPQQRPRSQAVWEKQLAILEKALRKAPNSASLMLCKLGVESQLLPFEEAENHWEILADKANPEYWHRYVSWLESPSSLTFFSVSNVIDSYCKALDSLDLINCPPAFSLFVDLCKFLKFTGSPTHPNVRLLTLHTLLVDYLEKLVVILRGFFDFNFSDTPQDAYPELLDSKSLPYLLRDITKDTKLRGQTSIDGNSIVIRWLGLERHQMEAFWYPRGPVAALDEPLEDFNREVVWDDVQSFIYWSPSASLEGFLATLFDSFQIPTPFSTHFALCNTSSSSSLQSCTCPFFDLIDFDSTWHNCLPLAFPQPLPRHSLWTGLSASKQTFILTILMESLDCTQLNFQIAELAFMFYAHARGADAASKHLKSLLEARENSVQTPYLWWAWCRLVRWENKFEEALRTLSFLANSFSSPQHKWKFGVELVAVALAQGDIGHVQQIISSLDLLTREQPNNCDFVRLELTGRYLEKGISALESIGSTALGEEAALWILALYQNHFRRQDISLQQQSLHPSKYRPFLLALLHSHPSSTPIMLSLHKLEANAGFDNHFRQYISLRLSKLLEEGPEGAEGAERLWWISVLAELKAAAPNPNRIRSAFERAFSVFSGLPRLAHSPEAWLLYLRYEGGLKTVEGYDRAKAVLYRAIRECPGHKELYLEGIRLLGGGVLREDESTELVNLMEEKGIRIRCLLEEAQ